MFSKLLTLYIELGLALVKPDSHMLPMVADSLSVVVRGENLQRILHISNHRQWTSPTSAIYENQALAFTQQRHMNKVSRKSLELEYRMINFLVKQDDRFKDLTFSICKPNRNR